VSIACRKKQGFSEVLQNFRQKSKIAEPLMTPTHSCDNNMRFQERECLVAQDMIWFENNDQWKAF
jgi:hypothetical protein